MREDDSLKDRWIDENTAIWRYGDVAMWRYRTAAAIARGEKVVKSSSRDSDPLKSFPDFRYVSGLQYGASICGTYTRRKVNATLSEARGGIANSAIVADRGDSRRNEQQQTVFFRRILHGLVNDTLICRAFSSSTRRYVASTGETLTARA
jgi:hypothetical protein